MHVNVEKCIREIRKREKKIKKRQMLNTVDPGVLCCSTAKPCSSLTEVVSIFTSVKFPTFQNQPKRAKVRHNYEIKK